uniref:Uncharacterized protein n=1 Tax=Populus trichocarpa TaxID=3694 RepID=A0A2K1YRH1_POPTR
MQVAQQSWTGAKFKLIGSIDSLHACRACRSLQKILGSSYASCFSLFLCLETPWPVCLSTFKQRFKTRACIIKKFQNEPL